MSDEIARLSADVARNPGGRASIALVEALRRAHRLPAAAEAARRALERHPYDADAHDVNARVAADRGDVACARDEWEMSLRLDPAHVGASLGLAFLAFREGVRGEAERRLRVAQAVAPHDARVERATRLIEAMPLPQQFAPNAAASTHAEEAVPLSPRTLFSPLKEEGALGVLLVDSDGHVVAGDACDAAGGDASSDLGAELCGLGEEATRALAQLGLGEWEHLTVECGETVLSIAPSIDATLVVVETHSSIPIGMSHVLLARAARRASTWLEAL